MTNYYRIPGRAVVHTRRDCPRLYRSMLGGFLTLDKKPSHTTICDCCQALDARDKRMAKKQHS